eukprot:TRINITY_DN48796_c0_g1_i1.p1 TRINITY_DN48796_c0_g1~~TRINITY_DN48796_c0_g1_i1.p1  ORF type:complete len:454 (+),score=83.57 TRINITY_DN48796_c0_g1_i1:34-1395(+)
MPPSSVVLGHREQHWLRGRSQRQWHVLAMASKGATAICCLVAILRSMLLQPALPFQAGHRARNSCTARHATAGGQHFADIGGKIPMPTLPGQTANEEGFNDLCTRWNREEAEAVQDSKRKLQSDKTSIDTKLLAVNELEYWAVRRGGYDAEIILIGTLKSPSKELAGQAHISLKKTWAAHFSAWVNSDIDQGRVLQRDGDTDGAMLIFEKVIRENPLWGEAYRLRAKCWNKRGEIDKTIEDLRRALEFCPNNYLTMIELGITLMDKKQAYEESAKLFKSALDLCPFLPVSTFLATLHSKMPSLKAQWEAEKKANEFSVDSPPLRLLPESWVDRYEATERPNQAFLRIGAELEQWFAEVRMNKVSKPIQRKLWSILVIKWDPDKHSRALRSFTTQVHNAIKSRRERELAKADVEEEVLGDPDEIHLHEVESEYDADAVAFLRQIRRERERQRAR